MPLKQCTKDGKSGWKFGDNGTCYVGSNGKQKALKQARAMFANGYKGSSIHEQKLIKFHSLCEQIMKNL